MAVLDIVKFPDPRLREPTFEVAEITDGIRQLVRDMIDTMYSLNAAGVAAIQVGRLERIFIIDGKVADIRSSRDARDHRIETIYQNLALADNLDACANLFLGREMTSAGFLDEPAMEAAARKVIGRLNPNFKKYHAPVSALSGGQRQSVAIARAVHFDARILIMDEPTAALGVQETKMVAELIQQLKKEGIGIFLISHDLHDVFDLSDRLSVMKNGKLVGTVRTQDVTKDDVLGMIILGKQPGGAAA